MNLKIFALIGCLFGCTANADMPTDVIPCTAAMLGGDSVVFQVFESEYKTDFRKHPAHNAKAAIEYYIQHHTSFGLSCNVGRDLKIQAHPYDCSTLTPGRPFADYCYLESKLGYFMVVADYFGTYNVTFVRWD